MLVGASRGGIYTRIYQRRYPAEVIGMVQIDPGHESDLFTMVNGRAVTIASLTPDELLATILKAGPNVPPPGIRKRERPSIDRRRTSTQFASSSSGG